MDGGVKKDIWSVMEDFSKAPGDKDLSKMKAQYEMFCGCCGLQAGDSVIHNLSWTPKLSESPDIKNSG
jgi:hypothetical protein